MSSFTYSISDYPSFAQILRGSLAGRSNCLSLPIDQSYHPPFSISQFIHQSIRVLANSAFRRTSLT